MENSGKRRSWTKRSLFTEYHCLKDNALYTFPRKLEEPTTTSRGKADKQRRSLAVADDVVVYAE